MTDREAILGVLPEGTRGALPEVFDRGRKAPSDLWLEFEERLVALGGQIVPEEALPLLLNRGGGVWADEDALPSTFARASSVWEAELGVCVADLAIAETGSLIVSAGPGRSRLTSLAPPVNVILVHEGDIIAYPEEAFTRLPKTTSVVITGTSRTADIEGVLVRGVHGPRELYVVKIAAD